jgi:hypothetical protein
VRREDGFGRIVFEDIGSIDKVNLVRTNPETGQTTGSDEDGAVLQRRLLQHALREAMVVIEIEANPLPNTSLLGRIRSSLRVTESASAVENYSQTLEDLKSKAREKLEGSKVKQGTLLNFLKSLGSKDWYSQANMLLKLDEMLERNRLIESLDDKWIQEQFGNLQEWLIFAVLSQLIRQRKEQA